MDNVFIYWQEILLTGRVFQANLSFEKYRHQEWEKPSSRYHGMLYLQEPLKGCFWKPKEWQWEPLKRNTMQMLLHQAPSQHQLFRVIRLLASRLQETQKDTNLIISCETSLRPQIQLVVHQLHWLPVEYQIKFKVVVLPFKTLSRLQPTCLKDYLSQDVTWSALRTNISWCSLAQKKF